jgi:hypothetical protein
MEEFDLETIIHKGDLVKFILLEGLYDTYQMGSEYKNWNQLIDFYNNAKTSEELKQFIKMRILSLFDSTDLKSKTSSLTLSRILNFVEIKDKIIQFLRQNNFEQIDKNLSHSLLVTISGMQFEESSLKDILILQITKLQMIPNFLLWSKTRLKETIVSEDDLWRMSVLANYYEKSDEKNRVDMENQLESVYKINLKARTIINSYFKTSSSYNDFRQMLQKIIS